MKTSINKSYLISVLVMTVLIPAIGCISETIIHKTAFSFQLLGKWFIFSAVGLRLFAAGIRQATNPAFTAKEIFHISGPESYPVVRELGFANVVLG